MKIGPMIQNPGGVLCHIFMVGLLSQVMDNAIGNMVNVKEVKDSVILAGGKTHSVLSQVVEGNIGNEDHRDVDVTMDNENNPEQVLTSQVVNVNIGNKYHRDMDVTMDNKNIFGAGSNQPGGGYDQREQGLRGFGCDCERRGRECGECGERGQS
jgi:hypothetical protein